jgi:hypothetical protein
MLRNPLKPGDLVQTLSQDLFVVGKTEQLQEQLQWVWDKDRPDEEPYLSYDLSIVTKTNP